MMKFRLPSADRAALPGELRVEVIGRFANYLFAGGWVADCAGDPPARTYQFADSGQNVEAEYSYHFTHETDCSRTGFLDLFWVNDGYRLQVGPSHPVTAALAGPRKPGLIRQTEIHRVEDGAFAELLRQLKAANSREVWTNRIVFEILQGCDDEMRLEFFATAANFIAWPAMHEHVKTGLASAGHDLSHPDYLDFLSLSISGVEPRSIPSELLELFLKYAEGLRMGQASGRLTRDVIRNLSRIDRSRAFAFVRAGVLGLGRKREVIADCLLHFYPQDSQWWIYHTLRNQEVGAEQAADALNCVGSAVAAEGDMALAMLSYEIALEISPDSQSPAWNAGWTRFLSGDAHGARAFFKRITRQYTHKSLSTRWPHAGNLPWPLGKLDAAGFSLPEGITAWPRISVVTPSYNQGCYIEETILSVLNQGYPNLQYIIVDGNSTDSTREVLERYRERLDHLIIESDKGQTEAINKGLRLVDGEIVAWINSDDVYAPGALHVAALSWLETGADLIAGVCIEHIDHRILLFNKPAASPADLNLLKLARLFEYWFKGWFFYQPEVFFTRSMLKSAGLLDESLHYAMDYDLWMRFAKHEATLEVIDWPLAFFRKHESQKTSNLIECLEEQARVRSRYHRLEPGEERAREIRWMSEAVGQKPNPQVGVLTSRNAASLSRCLKAELEQNGAGGHDIHVSDDETDPRIAQADLVILISHGQEDTETLAWLREAKPGRPLVAWFWDNHRHPFGNHGIAEAVDLVFPGHAIYGDYLRGDRSLYGGHIPLCATLWTRREAEAWFAETADASRGSDLLVVIEDVAGSPAIVSGVREQLTRIPHRAPGSDDPGASRLASAKDRFAEWCSHQVSLSLLCNRALSSGLFDALLAGQIPIVPEEASDLDFVIPYSLQQTLPILRFSLMEPDGLIQAYRRGLEAYAEGGPEAALARHRHALSHHTFSTRLDSILKSVAMI